MHHSTKTPNVTVRGPGPERVERPGVTRSGEPTVSGSARGLNSPPPRMHTMGDSPEADANVPASDDAEATATASPSDGTVDPEAYVTGQRTLAPRVRIQWAARVLGGAVAVGAVGTALAGRIGVDPRLGAGLAGLLVLVGLGSVLLRYRVWAYEIRADALYLQRGVVTHTRTVVPYVRIQHVDTSRGPFERALGLSTLVVYTAGSRGADVSVPGLTPAEASDLQTRVKELAIEADGGDAV